MIDRELAVEVFGFRRNDSSAWPWLSPYGKFMRSDVPPFTANLMTIALAMQHRWPRFLIQTSWTSSRASVHLSTPSAAPVAAEAPNLALALCLAAARLAAAETGVAHA